MPTRPRVPTALVVVLAVTVWALASSGLVQLRACVPGALAGPASLLDAHLLLLRPAAECHSGMAIDDGALAVVGTLTLVSGLSWATGAGVLAAVGVVAARVVAAFARLLDAVWPPRRVARRVPVVSSVRRPARPRAVVRRPRDASCAVVTRRGPPVWA